VFVHIGSLLQIVNLYGNRSMNTDIGRQGTIGNMSWMKHN
jgi:hypothetical protein